MKQVNLHAAKTSLSRLVDEAMGGEDIVIAKAGRPMVRLVPVARATRRKGFGAGKGKVWISDEFDAPLPPGVLRTFGIEP